MGSQIQPEWTKPPIERNHFLLWALYALTIMVPLGVILVRQCWYFAIIIGLLPVQIIMLMWLFRTPTWRCDGCGRHLLLERYRAAHHGSSNTSTLRMCSRCGQRICGACRDSHTCPLEEQLRLSG